MVSDKGPGPIAFQKRISTKMGSSKGSKVFIKRGKKKVHVDRQTGRLRETERWWVKPLWQFELLLKGIPFGCPLANHFDLPVSQSVFSIYQEPPMYAHTYLSQDGFYWKDVWVKNIPWCNSPLASKEPFLHTCGQGGLLTSRIRNMWSEQGPAFSLNCPAILILEFQSTGNESPIALPCGE